MHRKHSTRGYVHRTSKMQAVHKVIHIKRRSAKFPLSKNSLDEIVFEDWRGFSSLLKSPRFLSLQMLQNIT